MMTSANVRDSQRIMATRFALSMITYDTACWSPHIERVIWMAANRAPHWQNIRGFTDLMSASADFAFKLHVRP